jgi:hypothetical protein
MRAALTFVEMDTQILDHLRRGSHYRPHGYEWCSAL